MHYFQKTRDLVEGNCVKCIRYLLSFFALRLNFILHVYLIPTSLDSKPGYATASWSPNLLLWTPLWHPHKSYSSLLPHSLFGSQLSSSSFFTISTFTRVDLSSTEHNSSNSNIATLKPQKRAPPNSLPVIYSWLSLPTRSLSLPCQSYVFVQNKNSE